MTRKTHGSPQKTYRTRIQRRWSPSMKENQEEVCRMLYISIIPMPMKMFLRSSTKEKWRTENGRIQSRAAARLNHRCYKRFWRARIPHEMERINRGWSCQSPTCQHQMSTSRHQILWAASSVYQSTVVVGMLPQSFIEMRFFIILLFWKDFSAIKFIFEKIRHPKINKIKHAVKGRLGLL